MNTRAGASARSGLGGFDEFGQLRRPDRREGLDDGVERKDALERRDAARAELGARLRLHLAEGLVDRARRAIDPRGQHRVEGVRDVDDPGAERDLLTGDPVGIARSVEALMVMADRRHSVLEEAEAVDDPRALLGMALHERPFLPREAGRLQEDRIWDRELADVVEQRRMPEQVELGL